MDVNHNCFGTDEYNKGSWICRSCTDYVECSKVENRYQRTKIRKQQIRWKKNEMGKIQIINENTERGI